MIQGNSNNIQGNGAEENRGRKRSLAKSPTKKIVNSDKKRKTNQNSDVPTSQPSPAEPVIDEPAPDTNMKLKVRVLDNNIFKLTNSLKSKFQLARVRF